MNKLMMLLLFCAMTFALPQGATAFEKARTRVSAVKQKGSNVAFTLTSSRKFYFGANDYMLYIGNKRFVENKNLSINGKGLMIFYIPNDDFSKLADGADIYLTYGHMTNDEEHESEQLEDFSKQNNKRVWSLGKFSAKMLTK